MYSEEFDNNTSYNDEQYVDYEGQEEQNQGFWNENKGLIIKVIIVVLCVAILFWLILKLKGNNNQNNSNHQSNAVVYANNVDTFRLAAEKYFFLEGNMPTSNEVVVMTLDELVAKGYISEIVDANNKACDGANSSVSLIKGEQSYVLTINLVCSNVTNPQVYNYSLEKMVCLDCNGFTYMDGTTNNENTQEDNNDNNDNADEEVIYSCKVWSDWTDEKLTDDTLEVRTRVLVKGFKKGEATEKITYSDWSEYTTNVIKPTETLEVEMIVKKEEAWVTKTSDKEVKESSTIKDIKKTTTGGGSYSYCPSGYSKENGKCVKYSEEKTGDLTPVQYNTYNVINKPCSGISYKAGAMVYKNCKYKVKETTSLKWGSSSKTSYTYQELEIKEVIYYRSRTKTMETVYADSTITDYMEEKDLPSGYKKVENSEKTQYSYKLKECEK